MAKRITTPGKRGKTLGTGRKTGAELYAERRKAVQPLVSFKLPKAGQESNSSRRKALKYFKHLLGDGNQPGIASGVKAKITRRSPKKLAELQESLGQGELPGIKYAFVHTVVDPDTGTVVPVTVKEDKGLLPIISGPGYSYVKAEFNKQALFANPDKEIKRVIEELRPYGEGSEIARFRIANGSSRTYEALTDYEVPRIVKRYMAKYNSNKSNWWDWLDGLIMDFAEDQRDFRDMQRAMTAKKTARGKMKKLRPDYAGVLETLDTKRGRAEIEVISSKYAGIPNDKNVKKLVESLTDKGLLQDIGGLFRLTKQGTKYLRDFQEFHRIIYGS